MTEQERLNEQRQWLKDAKDTLKGIEMALTQAFANRH